MALHEAFDDLDGALAGDEPDFDSEPAAPDGAERADQYLRRLARLKREETDAEQVARAQLDRVQDWLEGKKEQIARDRQWLEAGLEVYHRGVLQRDPKAKTISLPNGTLKARAQQPEWVFDEEAFIEWALVRDVPVLRQKPPPPPEIDRSVAKAMLRPTEDGTVRWNGREVPGVVVQRRGPKFKAEPET